MPIVRNIVDVLAMKSDKPMRRLIAYYVVVAIVVAILAFFFPGAISRVASSPEKALAMCRKAQRC